MRNVDTIFALEFGQLLENHLFASPNRDAELEIIISSLNLKTKNQLAQVFAGYDVPTTASIFELIRTLNNPEFTERFFNLKAVNLGVQHVGSTITQTETDHNIPASYSEPPLSGQITGRNWEDSTTLRPDRISLTNEPSDARSAATEEWGDEFGDIDFSNL